MRLALVIAVLSVATGSATSKECGVYTDRSHKPGAVVAELAADTMTIRAAPDFEYHFILEPQKAGQDYRWGWTETDTIGGAKVRKDGENLLLEIGQGLTGDDSLDAVESAETFQSSVYVPYCPAG